MNCPAPSHEFGMFFTSSAAGVNFARRILVGRLRAWGYETDPAALLIGELAANAATHCPAARLFRLRIAVRGDVLRIEATDDCGHLAPELVKPDDDAESGRGLLLVDALATAWGAEASHDGGKTVWCECPARRV